jgi:methionyl-tRNA formyltransferase
MGLIDWEKRASVIASQIRSMDPWPGAYTNYKDKEIKLYKPKVVSSARSSSRPGRIIATDKDALEIETMEGLIQIGELQLPGKKRIPFKDFSRGFPIETGTLLGK